MSTSKRSLVAVAMLVLVFLAGFGAAKVLDRRASTASAQGQADRYRQVLTDLQRDYYKPLDVAKLGQKGITALLSSLHDPYTVYFSPKQAKQFQQQLSGSYTGIGVAVDVKSGRLTVTKVFPGSPAATAGIKPGRGDRQRQRQADGGPACERGRGAHHRSGREHRPPAVAPDDEAAPRVTHADAARHLPSPDDLAPAERPRHQGRLRVAQLLLHGAGARVHDAIAALQKRGAQSIIFDLRDNGGGLVSEAQSVASDFLPAGKVVVTTQGAHSAKDVIKTTGGSPTTLPLVVLVNGNTASASEIVTGALQDYGRGTVIGTRTFGKGVVQTVLPLSGGAELKITIASYRTPLGRDINHKGIEPSIVVPGQPTAHTDPALARALRFIATGH